MVRRTRVRPGSGAGDRGATPADVPGVSAAAEAGQLLDRPGHGKADEPEEQQLAAASGVSEGDELKPHRHEPSLSTLDTKVGTLSQAMYDMAKKQDWMIVSMKNDWKRIFAFA